MYYMIESIMHLCAWVAGLGLFLFFLSLSTMLAFQALSIDMITEELFVKVICGSMALIFLPGAAATVLKLMSQ